MLATLRSALGDLLKHAYPDLFGGSSPPVTLVFSGGEWAFDASSADATAGEPAPDDARDELVFDPEQPAGPYTLTRPPYPGPRRVYLRGPAGRATLGGAEVVWDPVDAQGFTLKPRPARVLAGFDRVEVLYGVTAVFTRPTVLYQLSVQLRGDGDALLDRAEALFLAAFALNRESVARAGAFTQAGGDYQAAGEIKTLALAKGATTAEGHRLLVLDAEVEVKVSRALRDDEGRPIERILTSGAPPSDRPVDVRIDVEA